MAFRTPGSRIKAQLALAAVQQRAANLPELHKLHGVADLEKRLGDRLIAKMRQLTLLKHGPDALGGVTEDVLQQYVQNLVRDPDPRDADQPRARDRGQGALVELVKRAQAQPHGSFKLPTR